MKSSGDMGPTELAGDVSRIGRRANQQAALSALLLAAGVACAYATVSGAPGGALWAGAAVGLLVTSGWMCVMAALTAVVLLMAMVFRAQLAAARASQ